MGSIYGVTWEDVTWRLKEGRDILLTCVQATRQMLEDWPLAESKKLWNALGLAAVSRCDLEPVSSPLCTSAVPSLQWGQGGAELQDPVLRPRPALSPEHRPHNLPGRVGLLPGPLCRAGRWLISSLVRNERVLILVT